MATIAIGAVTVQRRRPGRRDRRADHAQAVPGASANHTPRAAEGRDAPPRRPPVPRRAATAVCDGATGAAVALAAAMPALVIEHEQRRGDVGDPLAAILVEAPLQQRADWRRHVGRQRLPVAARASARRRACRVTSSPSNGRLPVSIS